MEKRKVFIIVNPISGKKKGLTIAKELQDYLASQQDTIEYALHETKYHGHGIALTQQAQQEQYTDIIVIGGDGTFNEAINGLYEHSKIPLSLIPSGTGNDFLKTLPWPKALQEQIESAVHGPTQEIDLGICNNRRFANTMGLGFDGQVVDTMEKYGKRFSGSLSYLYATVVELFSYKEPMAKIHWDGHVAEHPLFMMAINNGKWFGGGFLITPEAVLDDGLFDICLIKKLSILQRMLHLPKAIKGKHTQLKMIEMMRAKEIKIESSHPIIAQIDGEYLGEPPLHISLLPKALTVRKALPQYNS